MELLVIFRNQFFSVFSFYGFETDNKDIIKYN